MVGTAEYHVALCSFAVCQNDSGLNFVGTTDGAAGREGRECGRDEDRGRGRAASRRATHPLDESP
jgi:hypothetical protein